MAILNTQNQKNASAKTEAKTLDFDAIGIAIASPDQINDWSFGEVTRPETINYRTQKPERDGLFCERIFGPTKDYECYCGKYKKIRYKGIICDKCGVEVTKSIVRRDRMGHISLAVPVTHIWYVHGIPSLLSIVLDISSHDLFKVIYFASFVVLEVDEKVRQETLEQLEKEFEDKKDDRKKMSEIEFTKFELLYKQTKSEVLSLSPKMILTEAKYFDISLKYGQLVKVGIGAEAIYNLLKSINTETECAKLLEQIDDAVGAQKRKLIKRYKSLKNFQKANIKPEWLVLTKLPIIPPDIRPMVQLDGGRYASSDLNDLYRRVINRNNRLKRLLSQGSPEVIVRNEKRMLQEAVDALIDNSARRGRTAATGTTQRKLRSLSDMLRGKQGRFRQNLLGKRVDYSGRSVIVVGPHLKLNQCGIPKVMALELFKPFVISKLISEGYVHNVKNATRLIEKREPIVWDVLERITSNAYVLLNRAPTLHRLGIQAFKPVLIEGKALQIHPLVCQAFNADFDGDQMAVHIPLSKQAREEAENIMSADKNLLKPSSGEPIVSPDKDIILGCYYLTVVVPGAKGEGKAFSSIDEAMSAYQQDVVALNANVKVKLENEILETSIGRLIFNTKVPSDIPYVNADMDKGKLKKLIGKIYDELGTETTAHFVDDIKDLGFSYASISGITMAIEDLIIPENKNKLINEGDEGFDLLDKQYHRGLITDSEKSLQLIDLWTDVKSKIEQSIKTELSKPEYLSNPVKMMIMSGARGSFSQLTQICGIKGLVLSPTGEVIELPIKGNYKEGLSGLEYFISSHGARKGRSDTSLRTQDSGYLTRRMVDVSQDLVVNSEDCGTTQGITISRLDSDELDIDFASRIVGRIVLENVTNPSTKKTIVKKGEEITDVQAQAIEESGITELTVRSVIYCSSERGVCQKCYGRDLATNKTIKLGEAAGVMAAQAIGEPGTQLTLRTFHLGGVAATDITSGLPRVEELFEARVPKRPALISEIAGICRIKEEKEQTIITIQSNQIISETHKVNDQYTITVKNGEVVKPKQAVAISHGKKAIRSGINGKVKFVNDTILIESSEPIIKQYTIPSNIEIIIKNGQEIKAGDILTEGHLDLSQSIKYRGVDKTQKYIIKGIQEIYSSQGQSINDKHIEMILKRMFSKIKVVEAGGSDLLIGQIIDKKVASELEREFKSQKKIIPQYENVVMGISRVARSSESFLSAASFIETTRVLIDAASRGATDELKGLKENVIIGKLIPAGTGFKKRTE